MLPIHRAVARLRAITDEGPRLARIISAREVAVDSRLNFGIPDIDLPWSCGGTVNPSCFVGHQLVVLFLPDDAKQRTAELTAYGTVANEFTETDAWFLAIALGDANVPSERHSMPVAVDGEGGAWHAFKKLAGPAAKLDRDKGAAFQFTRGGALHRVWPGPGHAREVMDELLTRV